jgi:hypothetical protein
MFRSPLKRNVVVEKTEKSSVPEGKAGSVPKTEKGKISVITLTTTRPEQF